MFRRLSYADANQIATLLRSGQAGLLSQMLMAVMVSLWHGLDGEGTKRAQKLLGWDTGFSRFEDPAILQDHLVTLTPMQLNQYVVAVTVAHELHYAQYVRPNDDTLRALATQHAAPSEEPGATAAEPLAHQQLARALRDGGVVAFQEQDSATVADGRSRFPLRRAAPAQMTCVLAALRASVGA